MLIDSNSMERTFQRFFALQAERLCRLRPVYVECFLDCLNRQYRTIHRLETNKLRNTAKFFAHLFYTGMDKIFVVSDLFYQFGFFTDRFHIIILKLVLYFQILYLFNCLYCFFCYYCFLFLVIDAIPWSAFELFILTEETTTSASRIFIKIIFQELAEQIGLKELNTRLHDTSLTPFVQVNNLNLIEVNDFHILNITDFYVKFNYLIINLRRPYKSNVHTIYIIVSLCPTILFNAHLLFRVFSPPIIQLTFDSLSIFLRPLDWGV